LRTGHLRVLLLYCSALPCPVAARQPALDSQHSRTQALPCRTTHYCFCCCPPARTPYSSFRVESPCLCLLSYPFLPLGAHCHLPAADTTHHSSCMDVSRTSKHQAPLSLPARKVASHFTSYNNRNPTPNTTRATTLGLTADVQVRRQPCPSPSLQTGFSTASCACRS
jgi:hypothetical protein